MFKIILISLFSFNVYGFYFLIGNSNLVYTIIRKRQVFHSLASLPTDYNTIIKSLTKKAKKNMQASSPASLTPTTETPSMEGSTPALPAEPGTLNATLPDTPGKKIVSARLIILTVLTNYEFHAFLFCTAFTNPV